MFVVSGADEEASAASRSAVSQQVAFYGSTPAYRPVLELHGWGELQSELNVMSKRGQWVEMGELISDEILEEFAIVAEPGKLASALVARYGDMVDQWMGTFAVGTPQQESELLEELQAAPRPGQL